MATTTGAVQKRSRRFNWGKIVMWSIMGLIVFTTLFPIWWVLRTAFTSPNQIYTETSSLLPVGFTTDNFRRVMGMMSVEEMVKIVSSAGKINVLLALRNTVIFVTLVTVGQVLFSSMAAYAFARLRFPLRDYLFFLYVSALMVPGIVTLIPNFILMKQLGWIDTFQGMVAPFVLMTPFAVFFMRQFFLGISRDIEEAALIDGAGRFTIFWRVILPVTQPQWITLGIVTLITAWNEYLWPLEIGGRYESTRVMTVALAILRYQVPQGSTPDWGGLMAGTTLAIIPVAIIFLLMGRRLLDSIQFTGIK